LDVISFSPFVRFEIFSIKGVGKWVLEPL